MTISSSRNILKSKDADIIRAYVPPVQTMDDRQGKRRMEKTFPGFSRDFALEKEPEEAESIKELEAEQTDSADLLEEGEASEVLEKARKKAGEILQEAEAIRKEALEQAAAEKQKATEQGYQEGFEWGKEEGRKQALEEHEARLDQEWEGFKQDMEKALASVETAKKHSLDTYLDNLKDCAIAVGEKVIHISLQSSGAIIKRMIMAEVEKLKKSAWVRIYMGKTDYDMMMEADEDVITELSRFSEHVKFVVMNKEKSGDCIIEVPDEVIDISVDTQMENIRRVLENVR